MRVKDALNRAAQPANGASIAFTILVAGGEADLVAGDFTSDGWNDPPSRMSLATLAFPGLVAPARRFQRRVAAIILAMSAWLLFTCAMSWNIAAGHALLTQLDNLARVRTDIMAKIGAADMDEERQGAGSPGAAAPRVAASNIRPFCERHRTAAPHGVEQFDSIAALRACEPLDENVEAHRVAYSNLADWLKMWSFVKWAPHFLCGGPCLATGSDEAPLTQNATDEQWASILNQVLGGAVLPMCYGLLGAAAAIVRELWRKMHDSLLSPRDITLALGQLALGAVIGACIGLFVTPSGAGDQPTPPLTGSVTLSASALSFIAGFGVEGVFLALEGFIKRVFNISKP